MKNSFIFSWAFFAFFASFTLVSCEDDNDDVTPSTPNIVEFAQANSDFSILVDAVVKAELVDDLSSDGPFTLFAPDNTAFQTFLDAAGTGSVANTPKEILVDVLTNHVVSGTFRSTDLTTTYKNTLSTTDFGSDITTSLYVNTDQGVNLNGDITVTGPDNVVSNGIIHVINKVIDLPTVVTFALADPNFSTLVQALTATGLTTDFVTVLNGDGPFTVFAPTNEAFQKLLDSNDAWSQLSDIPVETLEAVLLYHVTNAGNVRSTDLSNGQVVPTLSGGATFEIDLTAAMPMIMAGSNTANIIATDVQAQNGVVHVIDTVILP